MGTMVRERVLVEGAGGTLLVLETAKLVIGMGVSFFGYPLSSSPYDILFTI